MTHKRGPGKARKASNGFDVIPFQAGRRTIGLSNKKTSVNNVNSITKSYCSKEQGAPPPLFQDHPHNSFHPSQTLASCRSLSRYSSGAKSNAGMKSSGFSVNSNAPEAYYVYPERTHNATDAVVGKSLAESDMSVGTDPAARILSRALRVANREFVYTITHSGLRRMISVDG